MGEGDNRKTLTTLFLLPSVLVKRMGRRWREAPDEGSLTFQL